MTGHADFLHLQFHLHPRGEECRLQCASVLLPYARQPLGRWWIKRRVLLGPINRLGNLYRQDDFRVHVSAAEVRRCLPRKVYDHAFKFAFARNPWDRLVSLYAFLCRTSAHRHHQTVGGLANFEQYLQWDIGRRRNQQHRYIPDCHGKLLVDFVGRFTNLEADFATVCRQLSVSAQLPRVNTAVYRDYRTYHTRATLALVAEHCREDIELFGYSFDGQVLQDISVIK